MKQLQAGNYAVIASLARQPYGQAFLELLKDQLDHTHYQLRTSTGNELGWKQGEAQCLAQLIEAFHRADELSRK